MVTLKEGLNELNVQMVSIAPPEPVFATLHGVITDAETLTPLGGVSVGLWSSDGAALLASDFTNSSGEYRMDNILPGNYLVVFEKDGYERQTR